MPGGQNDFFSVALHEIGHLLGIGTADSWNNLEIGGNFTGANSVTENGGVVPLDLGGGHWASGTLSEVGGVAQEAAMDQSILVGSRKVFTDLDVAGLRDVGWEATVVPVPAALPLMLGAMIGLFGLRRRSVT